VQKSTAGAPSHEEQAQHLAQSIASFRLPEPA